MESDWQTHSKSLRERNAYLFESKLGADCRFLLIDATENEKIYSAHKLILSTASPVFERMFFGPDPEKADPIPINGIEASVFYDLLYFLYCDTISITSMEKAQNLYYAAKSYFLNQLMKICVNFIIDNLKADNALPAFTFAKRIEDECLAGECLEFIRTHASAVLLSPTSLNVDFEILNSILDQPNSNIKSESELVKALNKKEEKWDLEKIKKCLNKTKSYTKKPEIPPLERFKNLPIPDEPPIDILGNGQLVKTVIVPSPLHKRPQRGDLVIITRTGRLKNGEIVEYEEVLKIHVGDYEVVHGVDMALPFMCINEIARIEVDSHFAYGSLGLKNENKPELSIPPNTPLVYEVALLNCKKEYYSDPKSFRIRREYGTRKKERANFWYNRCEYNIAIHLYRRALDYLDARNGDPDAAFDKENIKLTNDELQSLLKDRLIVCNNMASAQIKIGAFDAALISVETVLHYQPNNSKALYRKGRILEIKGDVRGAISSLQKAATLEPQNKQIPRNLQKLLNEARREKHNEKELYQKMFGQAKRLEQKN